MQWNLDNWIITTTTWWSVSATLSSSNNHKLFQFLLSLSTFNFHTIFISLQPRRDWPSRYRFGIYCKGQTLTKTNRLRFRWFPFSYEPRLYKRVCPSVGPSVRNALFLAGRNKDSKQLMPCIQPCCKEHATKRDWPCLIMLEHVILIWASWRDSY